MSAIECRSLVHIYKTADLEVFALQGLDMSIEEGEVVAIVGASGSGKTTLMNVLAAVEKPSAGQAVVAGRQLGSLSDRSRDAYRRDVIGYVWQNATLNLTPELTAFENLQLPQMLARRSRHERRERAHELLDTLGLTEVRDHLPAQLSGGEQQRLALGVAIANRPRCCWRMSPPPSWTAPRHAACSKTSAACETETEPRSSWSRTTTRWSVTSTACCASGTDGRPQRRVPKPASC